MTELELNLNLIKEKINSCETLTEKILGNIPVIDPVTELNEYLLYNLPETLTFDGSQKRYDTGLSQSALNTGYTITCRIYPNKWGTYKGVFGCFYSATAPKGGLWGYQAVGTTLTYCHYIANGSERITFPMTEAPAGSWTILTATFDGGTSCKIYRDSTLIAQHGNLHKYTPVGNILLGSSLGNSAISDDRFFDGHISHFKVFNRQFNEDEIKIVVNDINKNI